MDRYRHIERLSFISSCTVYEEIASTNTVAKEASPPPADMLALYLAKRQTAGRGQRENLFESNMEGGLWVSLVLSSWNPDDHFRYNRALALALVETLDRILSAADSVRIKWPNDVLVNGRKIAGILLETSHHRPPALVLGFGLNVNIVSGRFPPELRPCVTTLSEESGTAHCNAALLEEILHRFSRRTLDVQPPDDDAYEAYRRRIHGIGLPVRIGDLHGIFSTVEPDGRAVIRTGSVLHRFSSGPLRFDTLNT